MTQLAGPHGQLAATGQDGANAVVDKLQPPLTASAGSRSDEPRTLRTLLGDIARLRHGMAP